MGIYRELVDSYNDEKKKKDLFLVRYLFRPLSFPLTIPFIKLGITANQGTFINFLLLLVSSALVCAGDTEYTVAGAIVYLSIFVMDCIDGNIARYHNQKSYLGKLTDGFVDTLVYFIFIFIAIGNGISGNNVFSLELELLAASMITISMLTISYFRARLALVMSQIPASGEASASRVGDRVGNRSLLKVGLDLIQNLGVAAPVLFIVSIYAGVVSWFIFIFSAIYVLFTVAEIVMSLIKYSARLNVSRP